MKYFTKELYEEMQVYGSLVYSDSKEEQEEEIEWYLSEGRDYFEESLKRFELISPYMKKYLPKNLQKYIKDKSLMDSNIPGEVIREEITSWRNQWNVKWKWVCDHYNQYYESIHFGLPDDLKKIGKQIRIHDATIVDVRTRADTLELVFNTVENKVFQLLFTQVVSFEYQDYVIGNVCLYTEIALLDQSDFEIQMLIDKCMNANQIYDTNEMKIRARGFKIIEMK